MAGPIRIAKTGTAKTWTAKTGTAKTGTRPHLGTKTGTI